MRQLRLYHIEGSECNYMKDIIPGISAVYQMEAEFSPYLVVDFLPKRDNTKSGIILEDGETIIRRDYKFTEDDINDMRNLIWERLNIKEVGYLQQNDMRLNNPNTVIQGWQNKKRSIDYEECKLKICKNFTSNCIKHNILDEPYRLSNKDIQDRTLCKYNRYKECKDNYPVGTQQFNLCINETTWLCDNGYPNVVTNAANQLYKDIWTRLLIDLNNSDYMVDKPTFDTLLDSGLFNEFRGRMHPNMSEQEMTDVWNDILTKNNIYDKLLKHKQTTNNDQKNDTNYLWIIVLFIIFVFVISIIIYSMKLRL